MLKHNRETCTVLTVKDLEILNSAINPTSISNPWRDEFIKVRNQLIVLMLLGLGLRVREALGIRIRDIDFIRETIIYNFSCKSGMRQTKRISSSKLLLDLIRLYIYKSEKIRLRSEKDDYLFISVFGKPMSSKDITRLFKDLSNRVSGFSITITPLSCRHTYFTKSLVDNARIKSVDLLQEKL